MKALTISDNDSMTMALQDEIRRNEAARYDHRLHGRTAGRAGHDLPNKWPTIWATVPTPSSTGFSDLNAGDFPAWSMENARGGRTRLSPEQRDAVEAALRQRPLDFGLSANLWDGPTLSAFLKRQFCIDLKVRQCQRLFRHSDSVCAKPRPQSPKPTRCCRAATQKKLLRRPPIRGSICGPSMKSISSNHGSRCREVVPPETKDPVCLHAPTRQSISYFGAVRLRDGKMVTSRPEDMFNAQTCQDFLRRLDGSQSPGRPQGRGHHRQCQIPSRDTSCPIGGRRSLTASSAFPAALSPELNRSNASGSWCAGWDFTTGTSLNSTRR